MKNILLVFVGSLLLSPPSFAQNPANLRISIEKIEKTNRDRVAMESAVSASPAAKALHERLSKVTRAGDFSKAIADVVSAGDTSVIPYLKARLEAYYDGEIEIALVHLGENDYVDKTIAELSSKDTSIQDHAVWKLSMYKTKKAYRKLYELLDNETVRDPGDHGDYSVPSLAYIVKDRLASAVQNPPVERTSTAAWKAWFDRNRQLIN